MSSSLSSIGLRLSSSSEVLTFVNYKQKLGSKNYVGELMGPEYCITFVEEHALRVGPKKNGDPIRICILKKISSSVTPTGVVEGRTADLGTDEMLKSPSIVRHRWCPRHATLCSGASVAFNRNGYCGSTAFNKKTQCTYQNVNLEMRSLLARISCMQCNNARQKTSFSQQHDVQQKFLSSNSSPV